MYRALQGGGTRISHIGWRECTSLPADLGAQRSTFSVRVGLNSIRLQVWKDVVHCRWCIYLQGRAGRGVLSTRLLSITAFTSHSHHHICLRLWTTSTTPTSPSRSPQHLMSTLNPRCCQLCTPPWRYMGQWASCRTCNYLPRSRLTGIRSAKIFWLH